MSPAGGPPLPCFTTISSGLTTLPLLLLILAQCRRGPGACRRGPAALVADHALGEQILERFLETDQTQVVEHLGEEAGVHEVENGVLHAPDVLVDRQPVVDGVAVGGEVGAAGTPSTTQG
jgi:hypothetical protein